MVINNGRKILLNLCSTSAFKPRFFQTIDVKNPLRRKKSCIRKPWIPSTTHQKNSLPARMSLTDQTPPRKDIAVWRTIPRSIAKPLNASRSCHLLDRFSSCEEMLSESCKLITQNVEDSFPAFVFSTVTVEITKSAICACDVTEFLILQIHIPRKTSTGSTYFASFCFETATFWTFIT